MSDMLLMARLIGVVLCIIGVLEVVTLYKVNEMDEHLTKLTALLLMFMPRDLLDEHLEHMRAEGMLPPKEGGAGNGD